MAGLIPLYIFCLLPVEETRWLHMMALLLGQRILSELLRKVVEGIQLLRGYIPKTYFNKFIVQEYLARAH